MIHPLARDFVSRDQLPADAPQYPATLTTGFFKHADKWRHVSEFIDTEKTDVRGWAPSIMISGVMFFVVQGGQLRVQSHSV